MSDIYYIVAHRSQKEIDSFKTRYRDFKIELIPDIFKSSLNLDVVNFQQSQSWGTSHVIYFVKTKQTRQPLVLRANLGVVGPEVAMLIEKLVTYKVANLGIPTNRVVHVDVTRKHYPFDFQIQEMLTGQDIETYFKGTQSEYDRLSFDLGILIAKIHTLKFPRFGRFDEKSILKGKLTGSKQTFFNYITTCLDADIKYLVDGKIFSKTVSRKVQRLFEEYKPVMKIKSGSLIHHDLADHNIMFKNSKITGIFDWEACCIGDPVLDLASCPTWKTHFPREQKLIEGYTSVTSLPNHFVEKMRIYKLRTMLWKMVFAIRANFVTENRKQKFLSALIPFGITKLN